jgi:hypothetical protein
MDAEYFPPAPPVRQPVLLIDALRMATSVIDECFRASAADSITSLRAFDGLLLFRWFRSVLVLYQTCFRRIALRLHMHAGSQKPPAALSSSVQGATGPVAELPRSDAARPGDRAQGANEKWPRERPPARRLHAPMCRH